MTFYVNAWLDRVDPFISLHNRDTGELVARFEKDELRECLEQGDFCLNELCSANQRIQQELVKCLLLTKCEHSARCQLEELFSECMGQCRGFSRRARSAEILPFRHQYSPAVALDKPQCA
jgi:hypothetical protein